MGGNVFCLCFDDWGRTTVRCVVVLDIDDIAFNTQPLFSLISKNVWRQPKNGAASHTTERWMAWMAVHWLDRMPRSFPVHFFLSRSRLLLMPLLNRCDLIVTHNPHIQAWQGSFGDMNMILSPAMRWWRWWHPDIRHHCPFFQYCVWTLHGFCHRFEIDADTRACLLIHARSQQLCKPIFYHIHGERNQQKKHACAGPTLHPFWIWKRKWICPKDQVNLGYNMEFHYIKQLV